LNGDWRGAIDMTTPIIRIRNLRKSFGPVRVLDGVDLEVMPGDRIAILGASGSGKSTLLRCINALELADAGSIEVGGLAFGFEGGPARLSPNEPDFAKLRQRVGMVFQQFNLFPHMTTIGNVMEGLVTVKGRSKTEARDHALVELGRVGLAEKAETYPAHLSGGQKQRVAIARALAMEPDVFDLRLNSHSRLNLIQALIQAINAGADEALMLDPRGFVASCNSTNFFIIRRGELWTSTGAYSFRGLTQRAVIDSWRDAGGIALEKDFTLAEVYSADEAFITGTLGGVTPVARIDGRQIGEVLPGPDTIKASERYQSWVMR
jgi:ABC-type polar amino acid transport system ATPase subunit